jgi:hypothetical protein
VLVACEFSGTVRDHFAIAGHEAMSCDLLPSETPGAHYRGDVRDILHLGWDLMIGHPPCTFLTNAGARWLYQGGKGDLLDGPRWASMIEAAHFFHELLRAPIPRICLENPIPHRHAAAFMGPYTQTVQPYQFWDGPPGKGETKRTCLWLKNLPPLVPTTPDEAGRVARVHRASPGPDRWKERSRTPAGLARAMAAQWGTDQGPGDVK